MKKRFRGYALIVTVEQNRHDRLPDLGESVTADGDLIERVLLDEDICGYGSDRITRLRGTSATAEKVYAELSTLRKTVEPEDPVFFYFSGHGDANSCDGSEGASLFPWNADIDRCENVLTSGLLAQAWGDIPSKRKLAVVDACYSGGLRMTKSTAAKEKHLSRLRLDALSEGEGSVLISSSRSVEPSLILQQDSTSLFTKHLAAGMQGYGGHDGDGFVRVFDLFSYVVLEVRREAPEQSPAYAAYDQTENFPVACCVDSGHRKMWTPLTEMASDSDRLKVITEVFCSLYPLGPTDQDIWERAGGDLSQLKLSGQGRTDWFRAIRLMDRGGGSLAIEMLYREAFLDYPRNRDLEFLQHSLIFTPR